MSGRSWVEFVRGKGGLGKERIKVVFITFISIICEKSWVLTSVLKPLIFIINFIY